MYSITCFVMMPGLSIPSALTTFKLKDCNAGSMKVPKNRSECLRWSLSTEPIGGYVKASGLEMCMFSGNHCMSLPADYLDGSRVARCWDLIENMILRYYPFRTRQGH